MRVSCLLLFVLALCSAAWAAPVPIKNPGFELDDNSDGIPDGWGASADTKPYDTNAPERAHSGVASVRLAGNGYWQGISVSAGVPYIFRSWTRGQSGVESVIHAADFYGSAGYLDGTNRSSPVPSSYTQTGIWFRPIATTTSTGLSSRTSGGDWVWQDDVEVFDGLLRNGSLALQTNGDGVPDFWARVGRPAILSGEIPLGTESDRSNYLSQRWTMTPKMDFSLSCKVWSATDPTDGILTVGMMTMTDDGFVGTTSSFTARSQPQQVSLITSAPGFEKHKIYAVEVSKSGIYAIEVRLGTHPDSFLEWYSDGEMIASDDDGGEGLGSKLVMALEPGRYYALVRGWQIGQHGTFTIRFGEEDIPQQINSPSPAPQERAPNQLTEQDAIQPESGSVTYSIAGRIRGCDALPVKGARVFVPESEYAAQTDERGRFLIRGLPVGFSGSVVVEQLDGLVFPAARSFSAPSSSLDFEMLNSMGTLLAGDELDGRIEDVRCLAEGYAISATDDFWIRSGDYSLLSADLDLSDFSPNGDGVRDTCTLSYQIGEDATTEVLVYDLNRYTKRHLKAPTPTSIGTSCVTWDGKDDAEQPLPDDTYQILLVAHYPNGATQSLDFYVSINRTFFFNQAHSDVLSDRLLLGAWLLWYGETEETAENTYRSAVASMLEQNCNFTCAQMHHYSPDDGFMPQFIRQADEQGLAVAPYFKAWERLLWQSSDRLISEEEARWWARSVLDSVEDSSQILAFNIYDEPTIDMAPNTLVLSRAVEDADPSHRPALNVLWNPRTMNRIYEQLPPRNVFMDWYPLTVNTPLGVYGSLESNIELWGRTASQRALPFWMVLQGFNMVPSLRYPTPAECRYMAYLSLANAAKGILYYLYEPSGFGLVRQDFSPHTHYEAVARLYARLSRHEEILVSLKPAESMLTCSSIGYTQTLKNDEEDVFAFVVNRDAKTGRQIAASFPLSDSTEVTVQDVFRNTVIPHRVASTEQGNRAEFFVNLPPGGGTLLRLHGVYEEMASSVSEQVNHVETVPIAEPISRADTGNLSDISSKHSIERPALSVRNPKFTKRRETQPASLPHIPRRIGSVRFPNVSELYGFTLSEKTAYIAAGESGLLSAPLEPFGASDMALDCKSFGVALNGDLLLVACGDMGAQLYRIMDDGLLEPQAAIPQESVFVVAVKDSLMALSSGLDRLSFWDVSQPSHPRFLAEHTIAGCIHQITIHDDAVFVALGDGGLAVFDVSTQEKPALSYHINSNVTRFSISETTLITCGSNGLRAFRLTNQPISATPLWNISHLQYGSVNVSEGRAVHAGENLSYLDRVDSSMPEITASLALQSPARAVINHSGATLVLGDDIGLQLFEDRSRLAPAAIAAKPAAALKGIASDGVYLYLADAREGLIVLETSPDGSWRRVGSMQCPFPIDSVSVHGGVAYLCSKVAGFFTADVSEPTSPKILAEYTERTGNAVRALVSENRLYVASLRFGLKIHDLTDSSHPLFLSQLASGFLGNDVAVLGERAYLVARGDYATGQGVVAVDVSNPAAPLVLEVSSALNPLSICTIGKFLAVADDAEGVLIFDAGGSSLQLVQHFPDIEAVKVVSDGDWLAILTRTSGWWLAQVDQSGESELSGAFGLSAALPSDACFHDGKLWVAYPDGAMDSITLNLSPRVLGDLNGDGIVNAWDLLAFQAWWQTTGERIEADFDRNSTVDANDLLIMVNLLSH